MPSRIKLSCRNVWKLYGADANSFLAQSNALDAEDIRRAGLIGAVRNASIDIAEGEIFVIMGLSGSGKSTLVRCLSRLIEPTGGEVLFDDVDLLRASDQELIEIRRHKMGMVFQHFALLPHLTVLQNVMFPLMIQAVPKSEAETKAQNVVDLVGLKGREDNYPRELSGGQQQRVGIARSLVTEPDLWFLDEPFSALDPLIRREMQDEFLRLQARLHKTIVFITHDFDEAVRLADRIAIMKDGEIIQVATPEDLVMNPATDYVAEFTRHIPRSKVLTVGGLFQSGGFGEGIPVTISDKISDVAERIIAADKPVPVEDTSGQIVGSIDRAAVASTLFGQGRPK
ncbi:glycine betaine/L-proline ABC transporter ATP-binding protein [Labrenzia sp. PHM005]|uniref:quaternary amine ABC transporter ATP-binding protein n=1 Tax=Labrenzia sp. PHM005 TaxID=2590016 RepID=UPI00114039CC|nr:betaine/proline/choline family ABC transporter ATP-binding protein [Labrenzia sp. PHM005]QDG76306.1 betaine/proline/choline family ABC transporter ATP-binding protein [Labrenzia sp. PHM005]